jgi:hypothetical protein
MSTKEFETFVNSCFSNEFAWARDGLDRIALLALQGEERSRAEAMILAALETSKDNRPYEAAGVLRLAAAAPLLRRRITTLGDVLEYIAQDIVAVAAWALYQLGDYATAIPAFLRVMRLTLSFSFTSRNTLDFIWWRLEVRLRDFRSTPEIMATLLRIIADEAATVAIDEEFAALEDQQKPPESEPAPDLPEPDHADTRAYGIWLAKNLVAVTRRSMGKPSRLRHLRLTSVLIERIEDPHVRRNIVQQFEDRLATVEGQSALANNTQEDLKALATAVHHRLKLHEDPNVILAAGRFGIEDRVPMLRGIASRSGAYDAARAAVARQFADGTDAFPVVEQTIRSAPYQMDRSDALSLLAHLELTQDRIYTLLLSVVDNDDAYICSLLLDRLGKRFARSEQAKEMLKTMKAACKDEWEQVEGKHVKRGMKRPSAETIRTFFEMLDIP